MRLGLRDLQRAKLKFGLLGGAAGAAGVPAAVPQHACRARCSASSPARSSTTRPRCSSTTPPPGATFRPAGSRRAPSSGSAPFRASPPPGPIGQTTLTADVGKGLTDLSLFGWQPGLPGGPAGVAGGVVPGPGEALVDEADEANGFTIGATITIQPTGKTLRIVGYTTESRFNVGPTAYTPIDTYRDIVRAANPNAPYVPDNLVGGATPPTGTSVAA